MSLSDVWRQSIDAHAAPAQEGKRVEREFCVAWLRKVADDLQDSDPSADLIRDLADKIEAGWHV